MCCDKIFVPGKLPDLNSFTTSAERSYFNRSKTKKKWTERVKSLAVDHISKKYESIYLLLNWQEQHKRRDPDNIAFSIKFILDGLVRANIIPNDNWKHVLGWSNVFKFKKDIEQGVEILIFSSINSYINYIYLACSETMTF